MKTESLAQFSYEEWKDIAAREEIFGPVASILPFDGIDEGDMTQPFGGYKQSGNARDICIDSLLSYTQTKSARIRLSE